MSKGRKLTPEEIEKKKFELMKLEMDLDVVKTQEKHIRKLLDNGYFQKTEEFKFQDFLKEIKRVEHNVNAYKEQIKTGIEG